MSIFFFSLFSCHMETWLLTLREGHRQRAVREQSAEEGIWAQEGRDNRGIEETA